MGHFSAVQMIFYHTWDFPTTYNLNVTGFENQRRSRTFLRHHTLSWQFKYRCFSQTFGEKFMKPDNNELRLIPKQDKIYFRCFSFAFVCTDLHLKISVGHETHHELDLNSQGSHSWETQEHLHWDDALTDWTMEGKGSYYFLAWRSTLREMQRLVNLQMYKLLFRQAVIVKQH